MMDGEAGPDQSLPLGDRVRALRTQRGWSLEELSRRCGVSRSMLSQIERDRANPTLGVAHRIATAFSLTIDELLQAPPPPPPIRVIRSHDAAYLFRDDADVRVRTLSPLELEKDAEFYEVVVHPGRALTSAAHPVGTREFLTVQSGEVEVTTGAHSERLGAGDSAHYPADVDHEIANVGGTPAVVFLVDLYHQRLGVHPRPAA